MDVRASFKSQVCSQGYHQFLNNYFEHMQNFSLNLHIDVYEKYGFFLCNFQPPDLKSQYQLNSKTKATIVYK